MGTGSHVSVNTDPVEGSVGEVHREAWAPRGWAWLGGRLLDDEAELELLQEGASVCVRVCARVTPVQGLGDSRSRGCLSWAACKSPGSGSGWAAAWGGRLVAWVLEGLAGPALRTVGHAVGEGGARICLSPGCLSSGCLLCMSRVRGD